MKKDISKIGNAVFIEKFHFIRFEDGSFLSVEPKNDNKIYIMGWSDKTKAIIYANIANLSEDVMIVGIDTDQMPTAIFNWPDDQLLMLDREADGAAKIMKVRQIKEGKFIYIDYAGAPPEIKLRPPILDFIVPS